MAVWREYHEATKHTPERLRALPHYLDWANMPAAFRHYDGAPIVDLPAGLPPPDAQALAVLRGEFGRRNTTGIWELLSQILFHSAAISATKVVPQSGYRYALRVNPSSGNLHPTEFHIGTHEGLYHYRASAHDLEQRARGDFTFGRGDVVFFLTSIFWREAWKYRQRAYRYCLHDLGHAWEALTLSARASGYELHATPEFDDDALARHLRLPGDEAPLLIAALSPPPGEAEWYTATPNQLSTEIVDYPLIERTHEATKFATPAVAVTGCASDAPFATVARRRRSALDFEGGDRTISHAQLEALVGCALRRTQYVTLYAYVHRVDGLEPGVYRCGPESLELLQAGDQKVVAAGLSLQQQLAGNSCVTFSMVADLERATGQWGDRGYRYSFFEAGAIGQRLYVAAEALGFQSTGIGAFFDDAVHQYLNLKPEDGQVIYHFASGYAVKDRRITEQ